jgi:aspartyl/asparaginyl-tRNA synthetase
LRGGYRQWGIDLQSEHERYLTEKHAKKPVVVMSYPKDIKAFYMRLDDDGRTVAAMDVLAPGIGEIIGGSQREERIEGIGPQHGRVPHRPGGLRPPFPPPRAAQI